MTEVLLALPAHLRKRLERALDAGLVAPPYRPGRGGRSGGRCIRERVGGQGAR